MKRIFHGIVCASGFPLQSYATVRDEAWLIMSVVTIYGDRSMVRMPSCFRALGFGFAWFRQTEWIL